VFIAICESLINEVQAIVAPFLSEESGKSRSSTNIIIKQVSTSPIEKLLFKFIM